MNGLDVLWFIKQLISYRIYKMASQSDYQYISYSVVGLYSISNKTGYGHSCFITCSYHVYDMITITVRSLPSVRRLVLGTEPGNYG